MKLKIVGIFILCLLLITPNEVSAHPGRTDANGCHYCRTNCEQWGLSYGEYHCHNGSGSSTSSSSSQNNSISTYNYNNSSSSSISSYTEPEPPKSNDNTLKSVIVDGNKLTVEDQLQYETNKERVEIKVETNDDKATATINNEDLAIGENNISIVVKAEDGNEKEYTIIIKRLSNNTNIRIIINNEEVKFINKKASLDVSSDTTNLNYKYELEDEKSKVEITGDKNLKPGDNIIKFIVTAEDGTKKEYEITVNKATKVEETAETVTGMGVIGGIGYGIYRLVKKRKKA